MAGGGGDPAAGPLIPTTTASDDNHSRYRHAGGNPTVLGALLPTTSASDRPDQSDARWRREGSPSLAGVLLPTTAAVDGREMGRAEGGGFTLEQVAGVVPRPGLRDPSRLLPTPVHNDDHILRHRGGTPSLGGAVGAEYADGRRFEGGRLLPTPIAHDSTGKATQYDNQPMLLGAAAEPSRTDWRKSPAAQVADGVLQLPMFELDEIPAGMSDVVEGAAHPFGVYGPAVDRWAAIVGRPPPEPTYVDPADGRVKLNPWFSEWMMGLPRDWVAGLLPPRQALRCCGNGVVPQQGALAVAALCAAGI